MTHDSISPPEGISVFKTRIAIFWFQEDGILRILVKQDVEGTVSDLRELIELIFEKSKGKLYPALIDIRSMKTFPRDVRKYFGRDDRPRAGIASAYLVQSTLSRLFGNLFLSLGKSVIPTKVFTSEKSALEWLEGFRNG
ncbi:MAG: hypothetical protein OEY64_05770 [Nitrospinota bacterium]|nr:hypothetical protein [Nitrospinota bacterium]